MNTVYLCLVAAFASLCCVSGQTTTYAYQTKGYVPPTLSAATTCVKASVGNTPATCPESDGVPLTDEGKDGSTACVTEASSTTAYEVVLSLEYVGSGIPWCTSNSDCGTDGTGTNPRVICGTEGPTGSGNMCFPLAVSDCPFPSTDAVNTTTVASTGRRLMMI